MPVWVRLTVGIDRLVSPRAKQATVRRPPPLTTAALALAHDLPLNGSVSASGAVSSPVPGRLGHDNLDVPKRRPQRRMA